MRLTKVFRPFELDFQNDINLDVALGMLKNLKTSDSSKFIKTWLNGWATSHRMNEDIVLDCLLGCNVGCDSLKHYVMCPHLLALMRYFLPNCSNLPLVRLGVSAPIQSSLLAIACSFTAYHALKGKVRASTIHMQPNSQTKIVTRLAWSVFADAFSAEAGECSLHPRSFSLPKFIISLINNAPPPEDVVLADHESVLHDHLTQT